MKKSKNNIVATTRMAAAIWASQNKPMLEGKTSEDIGKLVAAAISYQGVLPKSTVEDIAKSAGITIKKRTSPMSKLDVKASNGLMIRRLAVHFKNLLQKLGEPIPEDLIALCGGNASPDQPKGYE